MLHRTTLTAALALAAVACEAPPPQDPPRDPAAERSPQVSSPGKPARPALAPEAEARLVPQQVTWPAASAIDTAVRARFTEVDRRAIDAAGLPVLAPRDAEVFGKVTLVAQPAWFTVALKDAAYASELEARRAGRAIDPSAEGGLSVFVQGNRVAHHHPGIPAATGRHTLRGRPAWITQNESIWSATWEENGVTYVVEVECSRPDDRRCATEATLVDVAESLVFVGGAGPVGAPSTVGGAR